MLKNIKISVGLGTDRDVKVYRYLNNKGIKYDLRYELFNSIYQFSIGENDWVKMKNDLGIVTRKIGA